MEMKMSNRGRGSIEHTELTKVKQGLANMPANVSKALDFVKQEEVEEAAIEQVPASPELRSLVLFGKIIKTYNFSNFEKLDGSLFFT